MIVSDRIIDARERFGAGPGSRVGKTSTPAIDAEQSAERSRRKAAEAGELRTYLAATPRLEVTDRKVLARNLGRAIERRHREERKQVCGRLFRELYGEDGGLSREKKRKRYIRFDDESLDDHEKGNEYAANGPEFLRLIDGLAGLLEPDSAVVMAREQMLLRVCDGAAFSGSARPRLHQDQGSWQAFQSTMAALLDRMARKTDLIEYLSEVQHYDIRTYPRYRNDYSPEIISKVSEQFLPITRFSTAPDPDEFGTDDYTRLSLDGFDIHGEGSSELYPRIRLARLYWPRQVLCLPASVPTATLSEIFTRPLSDAEFAEALDAAEIPEWVDPAKRAQWATREWKAQKVHELWVGALREAGYDPASIDWWSFEEEGHRNALHGAKWHTIWQTANVNLHIVADGQPEVLQLGVSFDGVAYCGWAQGHKTLLDPNDDVIPGEEINGFMWIDLTDKDSPFFEQRDQSLVCRGLSLSHPLISFM